MKIASTFITPELHLSFFCTFSLIVGIASQTFSLAGALLCLSSVAVVCITLYATRFISLSSFLLIFISSLVGAAVFQGALYRNTLRSPVILNSLHAQVLDIKKTGNKQWPLRITLQTKAAQPFFVYTKQINEIMIDDIIVCPEMTLKPQADSDFRNYLLKERVSGTVFALEFTPVLAERPTYSWHRFLYQTQESVMYRLKKKMNRKTFAYFSSLFMGDRHRVKTTINQEKKHFERWGILHHLARSGLHLMLFVMIWHLLLSVIPLSFTLKTLCIVLLSTIYFILTPWSVSFMRGFHLFFLYKTCSLLNLQINTIHLLSLVCFITLICNPFHLFFLDFQLSFFCTLCLAWLAQLRRQRQHATPKLLR